MASLGDTDAVANDRYDLAWISGPRLAQLASERFGSALALIEGDARWTFADLADEILRATRAALAAAIRPGDRIAIWAPNSREWIVAALGVQGAGATIVPVNTRFRA